MRKCVVVCLKRVCVYVRVCANKNENKYSWLTSELSHLPSLQPKLHTMLLLSLNPSYSAMRSLSLCFGTVCYLGSFQNGDLHQPHDEVQIRGCQYGAKKCEKQSISLLLWGSCSYFVILLLFATQTFENLYKPRSPLEVGVLRRLIICS